MVSSRRHTIRRRLLALDTMRGKCENYNELCQAYWGSLESCSNINYIRHLTPAEAITREYRRMVEEGLVPPMYPERKRRKTEEQYINVYGRAVMPK